MNSLTNSLYSWLENSNPTLYAVNVLPQLNINSISFASNYKTSKGQKQKSLDNLKIVPMVEEINIIESETNEPCLAHHTSKHILAETIFMKKKSPLSFENGD